MTFRCSRTCFLQVPGEKGEMLFNQRVEMGVEFKSDVDVRQWSRHFDLIEGEPAVVETKPEFAGEISGVSWHEMDRMFLIPIAQERGIKDANKMNKSTLAKRLTELDEQGADAEREKPIPIDVDLPENATESLDS